MGCLIEFIMEIFIEVIFELWMALMTLIVPDKYDSEKLEKNIKIFCAILVFTMIAGLMVLSLGTTHVVKKIGLYMIIIPFGISVIQIIAGLILKIVEHKKHKNEETEEE